MKILIVDDNLDRINTFKQGNTSHNVYTATTVSDALFLLSTMKFDFILLDHDMSDASYENPKNIGEGQLIVNKIIEKNWNKQADFIIHSLNPHGREAMYNRLIDNGFNAENKPFAWTVKFT